MSLTVVRATMSEPAASPLQVRPPEWFLSRVALVFGVTGYNKIKRSVTRDGKTVIWTVRGLPLTTSGRYAQARAAATQLFGKEVR